MKFFSAEDFVCALDMDALGRITIPSRNLIAQLANQKLQREAKVVYGAPFQSYCSTGFHEIKSKHDTHTGLLICVEEIERKPCEHSVNIDSGGTMLEHEKHIFKCNKCHKDISLKWEWEVVE